MAMGFKMATSIFLILSTKIQVRSRRSVCRKNVGTCSPKEESKLSLSKDVFSQGGEVRATGYTTSWARKNLWAGKDGHCVRGLGRTSLGLRVNVGTTVHIPHDAQMILFSSGSVAFQKEE